MAPCSIKWCGKESKTSNLKTDGITFHRYPKYAELKEKWIKATRRCGPGELRITFRSCQISGISTIATTNPQNLPKLPVPKLEDTLKKYVRSVRPFLNDNEYSTTTKLVQDFAQNEGRKLQALLEKKAETTLNWLEEWWINLKYLEYRDPLVVYSSPGTVFPAREFLKRREQLLYAARTVLACVAYKDLIFTDKLPIEMMGKYPCDMFQYKKVFGTCRMPRDKRDVLSFNADSKHIIVMHHNYVFHLDLWGEDNVVLNEAQLIERLEKIIAMSDARTEDAIGILTSDTRDNWTKAYNVVAKDDQSRESLKDIEKSLFILCLDTKVGLKDHEHPNAQKNFASLQTIHGGGTLYNSGNRWFDKTLQFLVGTDGVVGLTYEHSPAEGKPIAAMTDFIVNYIDGKVSFSAPSAKPKEPVQLLFNMNREVQDLIKFSANNLDLLVNNFEMDCFQFDGYGKNFIKSQKFSPDSYIQIAMQYAFYRLYKEPGAHYEAASTRIYIGGRTETIRSCSIESVAFAKAMLDSKVSDKDKLTAMKLAIQGHKDYTVEAVQGRGVDRHLFGLKMTAIENKIPVPKLFSDVSYKRSTHMRLSTSQVGCKCDAIMCFGPIVHNGYGTCYNPRDDDINFAMSAFVADPDTYCVNYRRALEKSLTDMHDVIKRTGTLAPKK